MQTMTRTRSALGFVRFGVRPAVGMALAAGMLAETALGEINRSQGSGYWTHAAVWSDGVPTADETVVLDNTTLWRQFQVAGASHRRNATGQLVRCEIHGWNPDHVAQGRLRVGNGSLRVNPSEGSTNAFWSSPPPSDWAGPVFDDSIWPQAWLPQPAVWFRGDGDNAGSDTFGRSNRPYDPVMVVARGKFEVKDPAQVRACVFSLDYWGGVAVYLNGREVARGHLSGDATNPDLVADDYPPEAWTTPDGKALKLDDEKNADRLALRVRRLRNVKIPGSLLRKGVNVLAIEAHAAPIGVSDVMLRATRFIDEGAWPPIGLLSARLTVSPAGAAVANVLRPRGVQVWNREVADTVTAFDYGDPTEPLRPIRINAGRNTVFSGRLVVGSDQPIKGLKVRVTDLASAESGARIAASDVRIRYAVTTSTPGKTWLNPYRFDGLLDRIPPEIPVIAAPVRREGHMAVYYPRSSGWQFYGWPVDLTVFTPGAVAPLWFTVRVPRDAKPGLYEGTVSVAAKGLPRVSVPLRVNVSAWIARDPKDFRLQLFPYSLEESLALYYHVPLWSKKHFKLIGQSLALGAEINARQVFVNLVAEENGAWSNPESLVRWIKRPDGSFKHDFTIFDKYLNTVAKAIGKPRPLQLGWAPEPGFATPRPAPGVSVFDPRTGQVETMAQPPYTNVAASVAFWKPVFDEMRKKLEARGWADETIFACSHHVGGAPPVETVDIANRLWPGGAWSAFSHQGPAIFPGSDRNVAMKVRLRGYVYRWNGPHNIRKTWEPSSRGIECKVYRNNACAGGLGYFSTKEDLPLLEMRWRAEEMLRTGRDGWASFGLDAFPLEKPIGGYFYRMRSLGTRGWGPDMTTGALLYPGPDGPVATERYEALREGLQLTEALLDIERTLAANPIGTDLLQRATRYRDERNEAFVYGWFEPRSVQSEDDRKRLQLAGELTRYLPVGADTPAGEVAALVEQVAANPTAAESRCQAWRLRVAPNALKPEQLARLYACLKSEPRARFELPELVSVLGRVFGARCDGDEKKLGLLLGDPDALQFLREYAQAAAGSTNAALKAWARTDGAILLPLVNGLRAEYYSGFEKWDEKDLRGERLVEQIDPPDPNLGIRYIEFNNKGQVVQISVRWSGFVTIQTPGKYTFYLEQNRYARLWVDNQLLLTEVDCSNNGAEIELTAGLHAFKVEYPQHGDTCLITASWSGPGVERQVIGRDAFRTAMVELKK